MPSKAASQAHEVRTLRRPGRGGTRIAIDLETVAEARLVAQALAGSDAAVEQIVRRYQQPVIRLITRIVNDPGQAEDLAQETFVKAFRNLAAFDPGRRLSSWLLRIAHNTAIDAVRRARPGAVPLDALPAGSGVVVTAPPVPDPVEQAALGRALEQALASLRADYRAAITLRYEEGLAFDEIAQVLNVPTATARSHVHRARKELLRHLDAAGWTPPARPQRS